MPLHLPPREPLLSLRRADTGPSLRQAVATAWRGNDEELPRWSRQAFELLTLLGLLVVLSLLVAGSEHVTPAGVAIGLLLLPLGAWGALGGGLLEQNHPIAARLVPGHLRRLRTAALLGWLTLSTLAGLLLWAVQSFQQALPTLLLVSETVGLLVLRTQHDGFRLAVAAALLWAGSLLLGVHGEPLWAALLGAWHAQPWGWLAIALLVEGLLLARVFGCGDPRHQARHERKRRQHEAATEVDNDNIDRLAAGSSIGERLAALLRFNWAAAIWLRHLLASASPHPASVLARAEFVLHGHQHWLRQLLGAGVVAMLILLGVAMLFIWPAAASAMIVAGLALLVSSVFGGFGGFSLRTVLWHARQEQALLTLLPGMPQGAAQTRAVVWRQLRHFLVAWTLAAPVLSALCYAIKQPLAAALPLAVLPVGILHLVRTPATMRPYRAWTALLPLLGTLLLAVGLAVLALRASGPPLLVMLAPTLAASAALLAWRWRALGAEPSALPAGRSS